MITLNLKEVRTFLSKKQVGIPLLVVATALITATTVFALVSNEQPVIKSVSSVKGDSTKYPPTAQRNGVETPSTSSTDSDNAASASKPKTTTGSTAQTTTPKSGTSQAPGTTTTPKPNTPTNPTNPDPTPTQPSASIAFSADGCFVTLTGAQGWVMTGAAETSFDENGNPRRGAALTNSGYVMPSNGPVTILAGVSGYSQADWRLTATLSDQSGNVKTTKVVLIGSSAPACS